MFEKFWNELNEAMIAKGLGEVDLIDAKWAFRSRWSVAEAAATYKAEKERAEAAAAFRGWEMIAAD